MPFYNRVKQNEEQQVNTFSDDEKEEVDSGEEEEGEVERDEKPNEDDMAPLKKLLAEEDAKEWIEKFHFFSDYPVEADVNDDTRRELAFETSALNTVAKAIATFKRIKYQYRRPDDYFVEMQKTDNHMYKVKEVLDKQREQVLSKEQRRQRKYMKEMGKHTEAQVMQERMKKKKESLAKVEEFKKKRKTSNYKGNDDFELSDDDDNPRKKQKNPTAPGKRKSTGPKSISGKKTKGAKSKRHGKSKRKGSR